MYNQFVIVHLVYGVKSNDTNSNTTKACYQLFLPTSISFTILVQDLFRLVVSTLLEMLAYCTGKMLSSVIKCISTNKANFIGSLSTNNDICNQWFSSSNKWKYISRRLQAYISSNNSFGSVFKWKNYIYSSKLI